LARNPELTLRSAYHNASRDFAVGGPQRRHIAEVLATISNAGDKDCAQSDALSLEELIE